jgi:hypothetical protein
MSPAAASPVAPGARRRRSRLTLTMKDENTSRGDQFYVGRGSVPLSLDNPARPTLHPALRSKHPGPCTSHRAPCTVPKILIGCKLRQRARPYGTVGRFRSRRSTLDETL